MAIYTLFSLTSGLIKLSILLFYRRLSSRAVSPAFRWTMRITIFVIGAYSIAFVIIPIFMCRPISAFWNQVDFERIAHGYKYKCINEGVDVVAHGIISTVQDLVVAFLPTLLCWNLQLPVRQKVVLCAIFALGYSTVAVGAMRTYQGYRLFFTTYDVTWVASDIWLWSLLELHIGSICANAPALRIFFGKVLNANRLASWTRTRSHSYSYGSKKQNRSKEHGGIGILSQMKSRGCFKNDCYNNDHSSHVVVVRSNRDDATDAHFGDVIHNPRDSMTRPLALEYYDTALTHDSYVHDIEMHGLKKNSSSINDDVQALPHLPAPVTLRQGQGRTQLPLSQVRTSWFVDGRRFVWRPWLRNARAQEDAKHPQ